MGAVALLGASGVTAEQPRGTVVVARSAPTALFIWDATPAVGDLVVAQQTGDAGMRALEADAVAILAARAPASHARRLEVRVQYDATGIVGAAYNAATFADATPLVVVASDRSAIIAHADAWQRDLASGRMPRALSLRVLSAFPQAR
jgi:hypothetical protein